MIGDDFWHHHSEHKRITIPKIISTDYDERTNSFWYSHLISVVSQILIWGFPKMAVPQNGWSIMSNPIKMDDLGVTEHL